MADLNDKAKSMIARHKKFVLDIVAMYEVLPKTMPLEIFSRQLIRSSSSVGANYRAACRAKSSRDFINKMKIVEEEADESVHWLELIAETAPNSRSTALNLAKETEAFVSITVASIRTARNRMNDGTKK